MQTRFWKTFKARILARCWKVFDEKTRFWKDGEPMFKDGQHIVYIRGIGLCAHCRFVPDAQGNRTDSWPAAPTAATLSITNNNKHKFGAPQLPISARRIV